MLWPFSFFLFGAIYSDALFLLLVTGSFLLLEKRWVWTAVFCGALATATRPVGIAVVVGLFARNFELLWHEKRHLHLRALIPFFSVFGLVAYMTFLHFKFGNALAFAVTQVGWKQLSGLDSFLKIDALSQVHGIDLFIPSVHALLAFLSLFLGFRMRKTLGYGYTLYVITVVSIPLVTSRDFICLGRYCLAAFPVFLQLAIELQNKQKFKIAWFITSIALAVWAVIRWSNGGYIS
jgi:hypothetical protein